MQGIGLRIAGGASRTSMRHIRPYVLHRSNGIHTREALRYRIEAGMGDFLSPAALKTIAVEYQQGLLDRLNDEVRGTDLENKSIAQTVIDTAANPDQVLAFNYASNALNNSFFLKSLLPPRGSATSNEDFMSPQLRAGISQSFMSIEQLKSNFGATALGMFNPGWVWLVCDSVGSLAILPTFGSGTLLVRSRQEVDMDSSRLRSSTPRQASLDFAPPPPSSPTSGLSQSVPPLHPSSSARTLSHSSVLLRDEFSGTPAGLHGPLPDETGAASKKIGEVVFPLMCVSIHEHAWLSSGYGVWGKEEYLKKLWSVVNWEAVSTAYGKFNVLATKYTR